MGFLRMRSRPTRTTSIRSGSPTGVQISGRGEMIGPADAAFASARAAIFRMLSGMTGQSGMTGTKGVRLGNEIPGTCLATVATFFKADILLDNRNRTQKWDESPC